LNIATIISGLCATALLVLGFGIAPLGDGLEGLCDLAGVASAVAFFGLVEGA
jgi:hypothetical protein